MQTAEKLSLIESVRAESEMPAEVRARIVKLVNEGTVKTRDIERFTSYSSSVISQYLNNKYTGDVEKIEAAMQRYFRYWVAKNALVPTHVVDKVHATLKLAWTRKALARIRGPFGRGKTWAAEQFKMLHDDFTVIVTLSGVTSQRDLLMRIAKALNIDSQVMKGSLSDLLAAIIRNLGRNPRMIIIDEADELKPRVLGLLRSIHDDKEHCAIVLIVSRRFDAIISRPELGYFASRLEILTDVDDITLEEAKRIAANWPHELDKDDLEDAYKWATRNYGLRSFCNLMKRAYDVMQMNRKRKIESAHLTAAYEYLVDQNSAKAK